MKSMEEVVNTKPVKEPKKKNEKVKNIIYICVLVVSIIILIIEGFLYYQRSYLTPFWVNGQSMYPTLNGHALRADGSEVGIAGGGSHLGDTVDYGVMDTHKKAINKIKRFDVIVTLYREDDTSNKIKRVVGMPGERIRFGTGANNGDLFINDELIEQPVETEIVRSGNSYPVEEIVLGDNEYYVLGDNRAHSSDSRHEGPIQKEWITGKAIAICGTAKVYRNDKGYLDIKDIDYKWPVYLK